MYDSWKAIKAQRKYCENNKLPEFFPHDGVCCRCHQNIFYESGFECFGSHHTNEKRNGYTVEYASEHLITGCPFCHRSYCD